MEDHHKLLVWHRAHGLAVSVHLETRSFPPHERFELTSQMRRSATSVAFNIAEACGRKVAGHGNAEPIRFLCIAAGSLQELDSQIAYARDVGYLDGERARALLGEVEVTRKMLARLIQALRSGDRHANR